MRFNANCFVWTCWFHSKPISHFVSNFFRYIVLYAFLSLPKSRMRLMISFLVLLVAVNLALATRYVCKDRLRSGGENESAEDPTEPCFDLQQFQYTLNQNAEVNKSMELECYVRNKGSYSVIWLYENQLISVDDRIIKPDSRIKLDSDLNARFNLIISGIDSSNKGVYTCQIGTKQAKNLEYNLDVLSKWTKLFWIRYLFILVKFLAPPTISRMPASDIISLNEGESLTVQCFAEGNPKPKLTWSKRGEKSEHTVIDELKSTLTLENVDESYTDFYSCTAKNDIGSPVSSEFQIIINCKCLLFPRFELNLRFSFRYS